MDLIGLKLKMLTPLNLECALCIRCTLLDPCLWPAIRAKMFYNGNTWKESHQLIILKKLHKPRFGSRPKHAKIKDNLNNSYLKYINKQIANLNNC